jgi:hypothetical protein
VPKVELQTHKSLLTPTEAILTSMAMNNGKHLAGISPSQNTQLRHVICLEPPDLELQTLAKSTVAREPPHVLSRTGTPDLWLKNTQ